MPLRYLFLFLLLTGTLTFKLTAQNLKLKLLGNSVSESQAINSLEYQNSFFDFKSLQKEIDAFSERLQTLGYLESRLLSLNTQNDSNYIGTFSLGRRQTQIRVFVPPAISQKIQGNHFIKLDSSHFNLDIAHLNTTLSKLTKELTKNGDPFLSLQLENIQIINGLLTANLVLSQNKQRTIDSIIIKGYQKFPKSYLKHYLKLRKGQNFDLQLIKKKTQNLSNIPFASSIKEPEVLFTQDSTLLYMYIQKQSINTFDGFLGFGTDEASEKLQLSGYLNLNLTNNLNFGESFQLLYKTDESEQKTLEARLKLPYLLSTPIGVEMGLNLFKKDSSYITSTQNAKIIYQLNRSLAVNVGVQAIRSSNLLDVNLNTIEDYNVLFYSLGYSYKKRQEDNLFPIKTKLELETAYGNRIAKNSTSQTKIDVSLQHILNLSLSQSVFLGITAATLESQNYYENELFQFGGINSIRGFEENSLYANRYFTINSEYRHKLSTAIYVNSILDFAYYENSYFKMQQNLYAAGFGFGIITKAGLLKLNYSNAIAEHQQIKLSNSKIHLSLSASF